MLETLLKPLYKLPRVNRRYELKTIIFVHERESNQETQEWWDNGRGCVQLSQTEVAL